MVVSSHSVGTLRIPAGCSSVRVSGHLDDHWADWLGDWSMSRSADGTTTFMGHVADQAQLYGLLARLRDIGAVLLDVTVCPRLGSDAVSEREPGRSTRAR